MQGVSLLMCPNHLVMLASRLAPYRKRQTLLYCPPSAKKYLGPDTSVLRPDASDVASTLPAPCAPSISSQRTQASCASWVAWPRPPPPDATSRCTGALAPVLFTSLSCRRRLQITSSARPDVFLISSPPSACQCAPVQNLTCAG